MTLQEQKIPYLKATLYSGVLPNGLSVFLLPRPSFHETYGLMTTNFGAAHTTFKKAGAETFSSYPAGIAHFLEHKLFEGEEGQDYLQEFSKIGADTNAYTSFYQTSYLFSTTEQVDKAVNLLVEMLQSAHFSQDSIEKEKGIIQQEIEMYEDDPDYRLYREILASLYPQTPLGEDIAGTVESISEIDVESLQQHFTAFYQPSQLTLFLTGNFDVSEIWQILERKNARQVDKVEIECKELPILPVLPHRKLTLEVASPKLAVGLRSKGGLLERDFYHYKVCLSLLFSMILGWTSETYQDLYEAGKIDSSFSLNLEVRPEYQFFVVTVDTMEPILISKILREAIRKFEASKDLHQDHFDLVKREAYGDFIRGLNSLEATASHFIAEYDGKTSPFDLPDMLQEISLADVIEAGKRFIEGGELTDFIIFPK